MKPFHMDRKAKMRLYTRVQFIKFTDKCCFSFCSRSNGTIQTRRITTKNYIDVEYMYPVTPGYWLPLHNSSGIGTLHN